MARQRSVEQQPTPPTSTPGTVTKPLLRGWLHVGMAPIVLIGGLVPVIAGQTVGLRLAAAVYLLTSLLLFSISGTYHRGNWSPETTRMFRRLDHANIFLFIAGSYTPLSVALLSGTSRVVLLTVIWSCAFLGVIFRLAWLSAPRWLYTALYLVMGWAAVGWLGQFWVTGGPLVVILLVAGGLTYSIGAVVYAMKRPNPIPRWYGFHEIFHTCTIVAAAFHYLAILIVYLR